MHDNDINPERQDSTFDSPPYRPPGARMAIEPVRRQHSGMGVASFVLALIAGLGTFAVFAWAGYVAINTPGGISESSPVAMAIGLAIIACGGLLLLGAALGVAGLFQSDRKKSLAVIGLILNGLAIVATLGVMALGMTAQ